jgi:hypothetical protein
MLIMDSGKKLPLDAVQGQPRQNTCEHFAVDRALNHPQLLSIQVKLHDYPGFYDEFQPLPEVVSTFEPRYLYSP